MANPSIYQPITEYTQVVVVVKPSQSTGSGGSYLGSCVEPLNDHVKRLANQGITLYEHELKKGHKKGVLLATAVCVGVAALLALSISGMVLISAKNPLVVFSILGTVYSSIGLIVSLATSGLMYKSMLPDPERKKNLEQILTECKYKDRPFLKYLQEKKFVLENSEQLLKAYQCFTGRKAAQEYCDNQIQQGKTYLENQTRIGNTYLENQTRLGKTYLEQRLAHIEREESQI